MVGIEKSLANLHLTLRHFYRSFGLGYFLMSGILKILNRTNSLMVKHLYEIPSCGVPSDNTTLSAYPMTDSNALLLVLNVHRPHKWPKK